MKTPLVTIGRRENISFVEFDLYNVDAKIDTGAYSTALHCLEVKEENGLLQFILPHKPTHYFTVSVFSKKPIKNSFGEIEERYIIKSVIKIGRKKLRTTISLCNRKGMRYEVLLGRKFLKNKFLVNVALTHTQKKHTTFQ